MICFGELGPNKLYALFQEVQMNSLESHSGSDTINGARKKLASQMKL